MERENKNAKRFEKIFDAAMVDAYRMSIAMNTIIDRKRYAVLEKVCNTMSEVFGDGSEAAIVLQPSFCSGYATIRFPSAKLDGEKIAKLIEVLKLCDNFDVCPLTTGVIEVSATVDHLFEKN